MRPDLDPAAARRPIALPGGARRRPPVAGAILAAAVLGCAGPRPGGPGDGAALPRVRAEEGSPGGGLPYRVWVPVEASPARPARLLLWLHPSGATRNADVEPLAPALAARGHALLVVTEKDLGGWTREEARRLLEVTLDDAGHRPGLDGRRPALLGYSAGGQMALALWATFPGAFAGVAIVGAEPVAFGTGEARELSPPPGAGATPLLVIEGGREPGARAWQRVLEAWRGAGVDLTLRIVPGRGHEWLLDDPAARVAFLEWVSRLPRPQGAPAGGRTGPIPDRGAGPGSVSDRIRAAGR